MHFVSTPGPIEAPPPIHLQVGAVRRRVAASDSVALLLASMAFGEANRSDSTALSSMTVARVADTHGGRR